MPDRQGPPASSPRLPGEHFKMVLQQKTILDRKIEVDIVNVRLKSLKSPQTVALCLFANTMRNKESNYYT